MAATARTVYVTDARMSRTSLAAHQSDHRRRGEAVAEEVMRRDARAHGQSAGASNEQKGARGDAARAGRRCRVRGRQENSERQ